MQARGLLEALSAAILDCGSATLALERWYRARALGPAARVVVDGVSRVDRRPDTRSRRVLLLTGADTLRCRRVSLTCGGLVLCEASNDYVPSRLTAEMNRVLDTTDIPFGRAVADLHFHRRTLSADILWPPERGVLRHHAILELPDGTPISEVVETYTGEVIGHALAAR